MSEIVPTDEERALGLNDAMIRNRRAALLCGSGSPAPPAQVLPPDPSGLNLSIDERRNRAAALGMQSPTKPR